MNTSITPTQRGFTFIETIVVVSIFTIATGLVFGFVMFLYRSHANAIEQAVALSNARQGVTRMGFSIRNAQPGVEGSYPIRAIDPYEITVYTTLEQGALPVRVRYFLDNGTLMRGIVEASGSPLQYDAANEVVATSTEFVRNEDLGTPMFIYYAADGSEVTNMNSVVDVRFVRIDVIANVNPARAPEDFLLRSSVALRNLKDNL